MITRAKSNDGGIDRQSENARFDRRTKLRYRLAGLLTAEKFDVALSEALEALRNGEILTRDLEFVMEIIRSVERRGAVPIDPECIPGESMVPAVAIQPAPAPASEENRGLSEPPGNRTTSDPGCLSMG